MAAQKWKHGFGHKIETVNKAVLRQFVAYADYDTPRNHKRKTNQNRGKTRPIMHDESGRILSPAEAKRIRK